MTYNEKKKFLDQYRRNYPEFTKSCKLTGLRVQEVKKSIENDVRFAGLVQGVEYEKLEELERVEFEKSFNSSTFRKRYLKKKEKMEEKEDSEEISEDLKNRARTYIQITKGKERQAIQNLCRNNLKFLCKEVLGFEDWDNIHDEIAVFLEEQASRSKLIMIPRKHLKSSMITVGKGIQWILRDFNTRILIANAIWDNARNFLGQMSEFLDEKSELPKIFGKFKSNKWNKDEIVIKQRNKALPAATIATTGIGGTQTSQHYDRIVLDDVVGRENIGTQEQRQKVKDFYKDCLNLVEEIHDLTVLGTTWHEDDLYNDLRNSKKFDKFIRPAIIDKKVIFPKKFTLEKLMEIKDELGPYLFSSQYLLNPYPEETMEFRAKWFKKYLYVPKVPMYIITVLDPSLGKKTGNYCGLTTTGVTAEGKVYILEARRFKRSVELIPFECAKTVSKWKSNIFCLEAFAMQQLLKKPIEDYFKESGIDVYFELLPRFVHDDKNTRILTLVSPFFSGRLLMLEEMRDLQEELIRFKPECKTNQDDIIDSLAWHVRYWSRKPEVQKKATVKEGSFNWWMRKSVGSDNYAERFFDDMRTEGQSVEYVYFK